MNPGQSLLGGFGKTFDVALDISHQAYILCFQITYNKACLTQSYWAEHQYTIMNFPDKLVSREVIMKSLPIQNLSHLSRYNSDKNLNWKFNTSTSKSWNVQLRLLAHQPWSWVFSVVPIKFSALPTRWLFTRASSDNIGVGLWCTGDGMDSIHTALLNKVELKVICLISYRNLIYSLLHILLSPAVILMVL